MRCCTINPGSQLVDPAGIQLAAAPLLPHLPASLPANCQMRMGGSIHPFQTSSLLASSVYPFCIIHTLSPSSAVNRPWQCNKRESILFQFRSPQRSLKRILRIEKPCMFIQLFKECWVCTLQFLQSLGNKMKHYFHLAGCFKESLPSLPHLFLTVKENYQVVVRKFIVIASCPAAEQYYAYNFFKP